MKVLVIEPMRVPEVKEIENSLKAIQQIVKGYIEVVYPYQDRVAIVCNEEGKLLGMTPNREIGHDIICGTFMIVGLKQSDFCSLTQKQIDRYTKEFK